MIYITGDTHRDFSRLFKMDANTEDILIVLGDAGINYYLNNEDIMLKKYLKDFKLKLFCIRGNHLLKKNILILYLLKMVNLII